MFRIVLGGSAEDESSELFGGRVSTRTKQQFSCSENKKKKAFSIKFSARADRKKAKASEKLPAASCFIAHHRTTNNFPEAVNLAARYRKSVSLLSLSSLLIQLRPAVKSS